MDTAEKMIDHFYFYGELDPDARRVLAISDGLRLEAAAAAIEILALRANAAFYEEVTDAFKEAIKLGYAGTIATNDEERAILLKQIYDLGLRFGRSPIGGHIDTELMAVSIVASWEGKGANAQRSLHEKDIIRFLQSLVMAQRVEPEDHSDEHARGFNAALDRVYKILEGKFRTSTRRTRQDVDSSKNT